MGRPGRILKLHHERTTVAELSRMTGLSPQAICQRLARGMSPERIVATPKIDVADRWRLRKSNPKSGRYSWLVPGEDSTRLVRRMLLAKAKRQDPGALAELRGMGLLTWQTAREGRIV